MDTCQMSEVRCQMVRYTAHGPGILNRVQELLTEFT